MNGDPQGRRHEAKDCRVYIPAVYRNIENDDSQQRLSGDRERPVLYLHLGVAQQAERRAWDAEAERAALSTQTI